MVVNLVSSDVVVEDAKLTVSPIIAVGLPPSTPITLSVKSSDYLKAEGKKVALGSDFAEQSSLTIGYTFPPFVVPGVLEWDGDLKSPYTSFSLKKSGESVVIKLIPMGVITWSVKTPAQFVTPVGAVVSDPTPQYPGMWSITDAGQTKLKG